MGVDLVTFLELVPLFTFFSDGDLEFTCVNLLFVLLWLILLCFFFLWLFFLLSWFNIDDLNTEQERTIGWNCASHGTITIRIVRRAD